MNNKLNNKKIGIFGLGKSGLAALAFLKNLKIDAIAWDDNLTIINSIKNNLLAAKYDKINLQDNLLHIDHEKWTKLNYIVISPGIPLYYPQPHNILTIAKAHNIKLICDIELFYSLCPQANYIGITGTNGKSTTTSLIGHILKEHDISSSIAGNIGIPIFDLKPLKKDYTYILEMSSFQLELIDHTKFNIAILLNITADHLDRHGNLSNYIKAKEMIFSQQTAKDIAIINIDNDLTKSIYNKLKQNRHPKNIIPISLKDKVENGISLIGKNLYNSINHMNECYHVPEIQNLMGEHNKENIAASFAATYLTGLNANNILTAIKNFKGLPHRLEFLGMIGNISFYNDSKATNAEATEKAILALKHKSIYIILGGKAKEGGISILTPLFQYIKYGFLVGQAATEFQQILNNHQVENFNCHTIDQALNKAFKLAVSNSKDKDITILLSPACASYDQWKNFEERGDSFKLLVQKLITENTN